MREAMLVLMLIGLLSPGRSMGQALPQSPEVRAGQVGDLNRQAVRAFRNRDFRGAEDLARHAWELSQGEKIGGEGGFAAANLGAALAMQGRLGESLEWQARAEEVFGRDGDTVARGRLAVARAVILFMKGKEEEAVVSLGRAGEMVDKEDLRLSCVDAEILGHSGDVQKAQKGYTKFMSLLNACRARGDSSGVVVCAMRLGCLEGTTGGHEDALKNYAEVFNIVRAWGDTVQMGMALRNMGLANRKLRQYPESEKTYQEALGLARGSRNPGLAAEVLNDLSMLYAEMGDEVRAEETDREAEAALRSIADGLKKGLLVDSVLLDFYQIVKVRFANLLPYDGDLFVGFYDQLALEPPR